MGALRGLRGVIAPPFYLVIPPVVSAVFAVVTAVAVGAIRGEALGDLVPWGEWWAMVSRGWLVVAVGLSVGLAAGAMALQGARPTIDSDSGPPWLGRATRSIASAILGGVAGSLAVLGLREYVGTWASILLVAVLLVVAVLWAIVAIIPGFREEEHEDPGIAGEPVPTQHH